jgi:phenylalanyl-tRNA synthetase beta chain
VLWTGRRHPDSHYFKSEGVDYYDLKGVLENLADSLKIKEFSVREAETPPCFVPDKYLQIYSSGDLLGEMGEISPQVQSQFDLKETAYLIDLDVDRLSLKVTDVPQFKPWPKFPETTRDMALILDNSILWKEIREEILSLKESLIEEIELFDLYSGRPIPDGKKNLGVRIHYRSSEKTLSDELVNPIQENLLKRVLEKFGATLRDR